MTVANEPCKPRAAFLTQEFPWPLDNGLKLRSYQILAALAADFDTTLISFSESAFDPQALDALRSTIPGISKIILERHRVRLRRYPMQLFGTMLRSMMLRQPFSIVKFHNRSMRQTIERVALETNFELAVTTLPMTPYALRLVNASRTIYECQNIEFALWNSYCDTAPFWKRFAIEREVRLLKTAEDRIWKTSGMVITLCKEDSKIVQQARGDAGVTIVPSTLPGPMLLDTPKPYEDRNQLGQRGIERWNGGTVGLIGNWNWFPSRSGLDWFLDQVMPKLLGGRPCPRIVLAGAGLTRKDIHRAKQLGINVLGYVDDLEQFYGQVDIVVGPYFCGGGVRVKILEAMLHKKLVIGTPLAFRGLPHQPGVSAIVCETADQFVEGIRINSENQEQAQQTGHMGFRLASATHDESAARIRLRNEIRDRFSNHSIESAPSGA